MPDDRYLDGDPCEPRVSFRDPGPMLAGVEQSAQLILDLLQAGREAEAVEVAVDIRQRCRSWLKDLEQPSLPVVDVAATERVFPVSKRRYKQPPPGRG